MDIGMSHRPIIDPWFLRAHHTDRPSVPHPNHVGLGVGGGVPPEARQGLMEAQRARFPSVVDGASQPRRQYGLSVTHKKFVL